MSSRAISWLAWSLAGLSVVLAAASIVLYVATRSVQPPSSWGTGGIITHFVFVLPFLAFPVVGALIASRRPENPIGWICLAAGILWMLSNVTGGYGVYGLVANPGSVPFPAAIGSLSEWMWVPTVGVLGTFMILLFPNGKLPSRRWLPVAWLSGLVIVLGSVGIALRPRRLTDLSGIRNPSGLKGYPWIENASAVMILFLLLCILASALSLISRFRRVRGEERQQIKWIAFAASMLALVASAAVVGGPFFVPDPLWLKLIQDADILSYAGVPIAVGFAVLRHRLYDIDLIINRALVYGPLTATLALIYVGSVLGLQTVFRTTSGQESTLAVVASTLAIAALFNPLRRRVQAFVDRRFYRRKYDAAKTLEAFGSRLRNETDLKTLTDDVTSVMRETMQPAHVSLWQRPDPEPEAESAPLRQFGHVE